MLEVLVGAQAPRASCMTASLGEEPASLCDLRVRLAGWAATAAAIEAYSF